MLQFPPAASLDLRWKDSLSASQRHRRRHRLCDTSCPSAPAQQLLRVAPGLRRLSSPRNLHLPFPPLSLLGLSSREGVHAQPDATPLRSARAPTQDSVGPCASGVLLICRTGRGEGRVPPRPDRPPKGLS